MKNIAVKQDENNEVPIEVLATSIRAIAAGIRNLRRGPLGESALLLLISENCHIKKAGRHYPTKCKISPKVIKSVLDSIESLQRVYLKQ